MLNLIKKIREKYKYLLNSINELSLKSSDLDNQLSEIKHSQKAIENILKNNELSKVTEDKFQSLIAVVQNSNARVNELQDRLEFVREEIMFELRLKTGTLKDKDSAKKIETKIISSVKIDSPGPKRINLGCGHVQPDGYINVDARELPGVDVVSGANELTFEDDSLDEIYTSHLIEHFTELELTHLIFPHWFIKLKPSGVLRLITPDANSMFKDYVEGNMSFEDLRKVTYGAQDYEGDFHYTMFTPESLKNMLLKIGFKEVLLIEDNRKNGLCREMEILAKK